MIKPLRLVPFLLPFATAGLFACGSPIQTASPNAAAADSADGNGCDPAAEQARLKATFDRTSDCAADALSAGFAEKLKLAGRTVSDTKKIVDSIRALADLVVVTDVSSARAILCVRSVTNYVTAETAKDTILAAASGLSGDDVDAIWSSLESSFTFGTSELFRRYDELVAQPNVETLGAFMTAFGGNVANLGDFLTSCGSVLAPWGAVAIPELSQYIEGFGTLGTVTAIAKCSMAAVGNAVDVATELSCLADDYQTLRDQYATLQSANDQRCETLAGFVDNPALQPMLASGTGDTDVRQSLCYGVISRWGSCVYDSRNSWGSRLSCDECARVCSAYVNGAGPNAYLQPVITAAADRVGRDDADVTRLVNSAATYCGRDVLVDGLMPCIHFCRGQVADCP